MLIFPVIWTVNYAELQVSPARLLSRLLRHPRRPEGTALRFAGLWCHIKCVNVSDIEYDNYCELGDFNWLCPLCLFDQLPNIEVIDDDDSCASGDMSCSADLPFPMDIIGSPVEGVRFVHHNVQFLLSRFSEVSEWLFEARNSPLISSCSENWITVNDLIPT